MKLDANLTPGAWHRTPAGRFTTTHKRTLLENQIRRHEIEITALSMASAKYFATNVDITDIQYKAPWDIIGIKHE
jgi:hypothetical protein